MKQGLLFLLPATGLACLAILGPAIPTRILAGWFSLAFFWVAAGYLGLGPQIFGKRANGTLAPIGLLALAPYLVLALIVAAICRWVLREPACQQISERLYFGRRILGRESQLLDQQGIVAVLDLTAATPEPRIVRAGRAYRSMAVLDGTAPTLEGLREAIRWIVEQSAGGAVYVHCAAGHGRAGLVAGAYLLETGEATDADEAVLRMRQVRPLIRLNAAQRRRLIEFAECEASPRQ